MTDKARRASSNRAGNSAETLNLIHLAFDENRDRRRFVANSCLLSSKAMSRTSRIRRSCWHIFRLASLIRISESWAGCNRVRRREFSARFETDSDHEKVLLSIANQPEVASIAPHARFTGKSGGRLGYRLELLQALAAASSFESPVWLREISPCTYKYSKRSTKRWGRNHPSESADGCFGYWTDREWKIGYGDNGNSESQ
ncbi:hypothetical protein [Agrobacterium pusense]|uniref:hypothetical protein n=1 Tax=Agrobacterium pusense TaxID=648995 RepID=UPI002F429C7E